MTVIVGVNGYSNYVSQSSSDGDVWGQNIILLAMVDRSSVIRETVFDHYTRSWGSNRWA